MAKIVFIWQKLPACMEQPFVKIVTPAKAQKSSIGNEKERFGNLKLHWWVQGKL